MPNQPVGNPLIQLIPFFLIFFIFYILLIKPQRDKQEQLKKMITNLKKNDQVITTGGIHGTVINVKEATVILRVDDNVKIEVDKEAITSVKE